MSEKRAATGGALALLVIATAQLMLVLDDSIVNIALPSIQHELTVDPVHLPWVVNGYILAFGALLLLGGRIGDVWGRKRTLQLGLLVFVLASFVGGLGPNVETLIAARAVQGIGAALASPNALALITTTFDDRSMRDKALSLYGAMSGLGIILGLILGGVLTGTLGWRWVFFINVPIGLLALLGTRTLTAGEPHTGRIGTLDAVLGTGGMVALVYSITRFGETGMGDPIALALVATAAVLLVLFVVVQARSANPLVPLSLFRSRNRSGAYVSMLLLAIGPMGTFFIITLHLQNLEGYGPLQTGLSWLPFALGIFIGAGAGPKLILRFSPRFVAALSVVFAAGATFWFSRISFDTAYWWHLAPAMLFLAIGYGMGIMALTQAAIYDVEPARAGIASALLNSAQQIGVAIGLALLAGIAATVTATRMGPEATGAEVTPEALLEGYQFALMAGSIVVLVAGIVAILALRAPVPAGTDREPVS
ncbi:MFS transporter [Brevibacterium sp.]|uniref:MFS transporter n=1 Tax=Brevibacterium sp. TaxID=1701 RepID=UPI002811AF42|nr:MFS transporter [Brevibacterium sp.]